MTTDQPRRRSGPRAVISLLTTRHPGMAAALVVSSLVAGFLESAILVVVAQVAAALVAASTDVVADVGPFVVRAGVGAVLGVAFTCAVLRLGLQVGVAYLPARIAADVQSDLRNRLFDGFSDASWHLQAEERDGDLQELLTNQLTQAMQGVLYASALITSALAFVALGASALLLSVPVALALVAAAGLLSLALRPLNRVGSRHSEELSAASLTYAEGVTQAVQVAEETQAFGTACAQREQMRVRVETAHSPYLGTLFLGKLSPYLYQSLAILVIVGGLLGLYLADAGDIAILGAVVLMLVRSATYAQQAHAAYHFVQQAVPFVDRLLVAEERYRAATLPKGRRPVGELLVVGCDHVYFAYPRGPAVLIDVSFEVASGESIGIVGPSGAGKSTLLQVLLRLREPDSGAFVVNGRTASDFSLDDWRRHVAYVPQDTRIVPGTVADNIRFLRDIDDRQVEHAARLAHIHEDIETWPAGYETPIGQRADAVSGGQRQRICLARALAGRPDMLVLDEPTSAVDLRSESLIQESLARLRGHVTLFVVSHRLSTLSVCDRVIVLANGRIEAFGPTPHLMQHNAFYQGAVALTARTTS
jgi:ATP-binding cassette, subfamily B, bacterial